MQTETHCGECEWTHVRHADPHDGEVQSPYQDDGQRLSQKL